MSIDKSFDLSDKVAILTGASKGIGEAMARFMGMAGAKVIVSSRKQDAIDQVVNSLQEQGIEATAIACHVGDAEQRKQLVDKTLEKYGRIDILVNNAATNPVFGGVAQVEEEAFDKIMAVNVKAPFELAKLVRATMKNQKSGSIINISSIGGVSPEPNLGIYSVSKAALISLTKVIAKEWGSYGIRCNVICPGLIKTKFSQALWSNDAILKHVTEQLPIPRIGTPEEIAGLALFLASDAASYCTGGVYMADGGYTI